MTTLLEALMSLPPEQLVEGAQVEVTRADGTVYVVTMGERVPVEDVLSISYRQRWNTTVCG